MPTIIVQTTHSDQATLRERVLAEHLRDEHYAAQLIERLRWATDDADALEPREGAEAPEPRWLIPNPG